MKLKIKKPIKIKYINNIKDVKSCALEWISGFSLQIVGLIFIYIGISLNDFDGSSLFAFIPGIILQLIGIFFCVKSSYHFLEHVDRLQNIEDNILIVNKNLLMVNENLENIDDHICEGFNLLIENIDNITK